MRSAYAHDAVLEMQEDADERAPGGAVTLALCGSWEHDGPCPLAPHHTATRRSATALLVRVVFAAEAEREAEVRSLITGALTAGRLAVPSIGTGCWRLVEEGPSELNAGEHEHAARLVASE